MFEQECDLLRKSEEVKAVTFRNLPGLTGAMQFVFSIWNFRAARKVKKIILQFRPDIVQIYNWHFATGPVIIRVAKKLNINVVVIMANYRLLCPSATLAYKGKLFTQSIDKKGFPWAAVRNKVYRNSFIQTFWLAFIVFFHHKIGTWRKVDQFIVPTDTVKKLFTDHNSYLHIPSDKIIVKPNFSKNGVFLPSKKRGRHFLFIGRLSEEKGILLLLDAFENSSYELVIAGGGPLLNVVKETCSRFSNIRYVGMLNEDGVKGALNSCTALVFPSIWYEPFGLVISEAYSNGCPVIASNIGSPSELVLEGITGLQFIAGDKKSLQSRLAFWQNLNDFDREKYRENCRSIYKKLYTPEGNREKLLAIYHSVMDKGLADHAK